MIHDPFIRGWLDRFAACVRQRDIEAGSALFDAEVRAFGTWMQHAEGLPDLAEQQWRQVWFRTEGFRFLDETMSALHSADGTQVCVLGLWESRGQDAAGGPFSRKGRCTILLRRHDAGQTGYLATHSHFSLMPEGRL